MNKPATLAPPLSTVPPPPFNGQIAGTPAKLTLLVLCGLPGSGKSTIAAALTSHASQSWIRASQDDAPSRRRQECEAMVRQGLRDGFNVVVDRVGFDRSQRAHFIRIAREPEFASHVQVHCLILNVPIPALQDRLYLRQEHPTLPDFDTALRVLGQMQRQYIPPSRGQPEGFRRVWTLPAEDQPDWGIWTDQLVDGLLERIEREGYADGPVAASSGGYGQWRPQRREYDQQYGQQHGYQSGHQSNTGSWRSPLPTFASPQPRAPGPM